MKLRLSASLLVLCAGALYAGCTAATPDAPEDSVYDPNDGEATEAEYTDRVDFNKNNVLSDEALTDWTAMTASEIQAFLDVTPYGWKSVLANHQSNGKSAAQALADAAQNNQINPIVILTRLQLEQSLIGKQSATQTALDWAMGCGCPDNQPCNPAYKGFDKQVSCMASKFHHYLEDIATDNSTVAGWGVGVTKTTLDGFAVTPDNAATASIYTYTPWASSAKNHLKIWTLYTGYVGYVPPSLQPSTGSGGDPGGGGSPTTPTTVEVVVDSNNANNGSDAKFTAATTWTASSSTSGYYGSDYKYRSTGASADAATFEIYLAEPHAVVIEAWWTSGTNRATSAPFVVYNGSGQHLGTYYANQQQGGGGWNSIGSFDLTAGWNKIALSRWTTAGYVVIADAVRVRTP